MNTPDDTNQNGYLAASETFVVTFPIHRQLKSTRMRHEVPPKLQFLACGNRESQTPREELGKISSNLSSARVFDG